MCVYGVYGAFFLHADIMMLIRSVDDDDDVPGMIQVDSTSSSVYGSYMNAAAGMMCVGCTMCIISDHDDRDL